MLFRFTLAVGRVHLAVVPLLPSAQSLWEDFVAVPCPLLLRFSGHVTPAGTQLGLKVCGLDGAEGVRAGCGPSPAATFAGGLTQSPPQAPAAQALCLKCPGGWETSWLTLLIPTPPHRSQVPTAQAAGW